MAQKSDAVSTVGRLATKTGDKGHYNAVIETPKGSRNKYKFEPGLALFRLHRVLPAGAVFPYDFGFIPNTLGEDGDPVDVLVLMDQPAFTGCVVEARVIGVIEAEQTEQGRTFRNDRIIAAAVPSVDHGDLQTIRDVDGHLLEELEHFFRSYGEMEGKVFQPLGIRGPRQARRLIADGMKAFRKKYK